MNRGAWHSDVILTNSLPDSYAPLVVQSARTLRNVITCLIGEERRQIGEKHKNGDQEDNSLALYSAKRKRRKREDITCFGCGERAISALNAPRKRLMR